jgi:hypothetical protein
MPQLSEAKISKKQLEAWLKGQGYQKMPSYEAYGRKVHAYVPVPPGKSRKEFERELELELGAKANPRWNKGSNSATEVTNISYFKARHWDESRARSLPKLIAEARSLMDAGWNPKAQAFYDEYVKGTWKEPHEGIRKVLDAFSSKQPLDTGFYVGKALVTRINKPGGKYKHGSVSLKSVEGHGKDVIDLIILADKVRKG